MISRKTHFLNSLYSCGKVIFLLSMYLLFKLYIQVDLSLIFWHLLISVFPVYHIIAKGFIKVPCLLKRHRFRIYLV